MNSFQITEFLFIFQKLFYYKLITYSFNTEINITGDGNISISKFIVTDILKEVIFVRRKFSRIREMFQGVPLKHLKTAMPHSDVCKR